MVLRSLTGSREPTHIAEAVWNLLTWPRLFPVALLIVGSIVAILALRPQRGRHVAWFGIAFFALWVAMQPLLYPRFVLLMLPVAVLCLGMLIPGRVAKHGSVARLVQVALVALVTVSVVLSRDSIRYALDGNKAAYHRHTCSILCTDG